MQVFTYNTTKLIIDEETKNTCVNSLIDDIKTDKHVDKHYNFKIMECDITSEQILLEFIPLVLGNIILEYSSEYHDVAVNIYNRYTNPQYYRINVTINDGCFLLTIENLNIINIRIINTISKNDMKCINYVLENNKLHSFVKMNYDELYFACKEISNAIFGYNKYYTFFSLMADIITESMMDTLVLAYVMYNDLSKKLNHH